MRGCLLGGGRSPGFQRGCSKIQGEESGEPRGIPSTFTNSLHLSKSCKAREGSMRKLVFGGALFLGLTSTIGATVLLTTWTTPVNTNLGTLCLPAQSACCLPAVQQTTNPPPPVTQSPPVFTVPAPPPAIPPAPVDPPAVYTPPPPPDPLAPPPPPPDPLAPPPPATVTVTIAGTRPDYTFDAAKESFTPQPANAATTVQTSYSVGNGLPSGTARYVPTGEF